MGSPEYDRSDALSVDFHTFDTIRRDRAFDQRVFTQFSKPLGRLPREQLLFTSVLGKVVQEPHGRRGNLWRLMDEQLQCFHLITNQVMRSKLEELVGAGVCLRPVTNGNQTSPPPLKCKGAMRVLYWGI